jgi:hypothetical protein
MSMTKKADPDPNPLVRDMGPRIQIRIHTKMSLIRNTGSKIIFWPVMTHLQVVLLSI